MTVAASLLVDIGLTGLQEVTGGLDKADSAVKGFGASAASMLGGAVVVGAAAAAAGLGAFGVASVGAAATFEQSLSSIQAVSGATAEEMEQIQAVALKLGADTAFSAQEAAAGFEELIKGGLSTADAMAAAAPMLDLAAAGGISVANAAEIAANAIGIFGLKGADMTNVANQIAGAANASSLSVGDFQMSMAAAGSVAAGVGQSFDDLATAIAVMGKSGIKGGDAGTSLKTMLLNLQPTTDKQVQLFDDLGITVDGMSNKFLNADGSFKSMAEIAEVLQNSTAGLTEAQRAQALETMFGSDAIRAANIFVKEGAEGFDAMAASMGKVTAESVAATRMDNFKGAIDAMKGSIETFQITVGSALLPLLSSLVTDYITPAVNAATAFATAFLASGDKLAFLTTAIDGLLPGFGVLVDWLQTAIPAALAVVMPYLDSLSAWFSETATAALDGYVTYFTGIWDQVVGIVQTVLPQIQSIIETVFGIITTFISEHGDEIMAVLGAAWETVTSLISTAVETVGTIVSTAFQVVSEFLAENSEEIQTLLDTAWATVATIIEGAMVVITEVIIPAFEGIASFISDHSEEIKAVLQTAWDLISTAVSTALNVIQGVVRTIMAVVRGDWSTAWEEIKATAQTLWDGIKSVVDIAINAVKGVIEAVLPTIQAALSTAWDTIKTVAAAAWEALRSTVETKIGEVIVFVQGLPGKIVSALSGLAGSLVSIGAAAIQGLIDGLKSIDVGSILGGILNGAIAAAKRAITSHSPSKKTRDELGKPMGEGIVAGIELTEDAVAEALVSTVVTAVAKTRQSLDAVEARFGKFIRSLQETAADADSYLTDIGEALSGDLDEGHRKMLQPVEAVEARFRKFIEALQGTANDVELIAPTIVAPLEMVPDQLAGIVDRWNAEVDRIRPPVFGTGDLVFVPGSDSRPDDSNQTKPGKGGGELTSQSLTPLPSLSSGGSTTSYATTLEAGAITIVQQPGEDVNRLVDRILSEMDRRNRLARTR